jgi:hypothetical protein
MTGWLRSCYIYYLPDFTGLQYRGQLKKFGEKRRVADKEVTGDSDQRKKKRGTGKKKTPSVQDRGVAL